MMAEKRGYLECERKARIIPARLNCVDSLARDAQSFGQFGLGQVVPSAEDS